MVLIGKGKGRERVKLKTDEGLNLHPDANEEGVD